MVFPVPPFCAIKVTVYILTTLCFEHLLVELSRVRFLSGLGESRGSCSPAATILRNTGAGDLDEVHAKIRVGLA